MKHRIRLLLPILAVLLSLLLGACARKYSSTGEALPDSIPPEYGYDGADDAEKGETEIGEVASGTNDLDTRKLIKTVTLRIQTTAFDDFTAGMMESLAACGGYVESSDRSGGGQYDELRRASYTVRVPQEQLAAFRAAVGNMATVSYESENLQDVTMTYVDMESRIEALETERESLLRILEQAETVADIITVQDRITTVNYEIDSYRERLRVYDSLISYSTVTLSVTEVQRITVVGEEGAGARIRQQLSENLADIGNGAVDVFVFLVSALPYLLLLAVFFVGLPLLIVRIVRAARKKRAKRAQQSEK